MVILWLQVSILFRENAYAMLKKKNSNFIQCLHNTDGVATGLRMLRVLYPSFTATNVSVCCVCMFDKIEEGSEPYVNIFNMLGRQMKCVFG